MNNFIHLIVCTHTPRYLDAVLRAAAAQEEKPRTISVSVDGDDPRVIEICRERASADGISIFVTAREAHGTMRLAQTRNNAVRCLWASGQCDGLLLFIDGDIVLAPDAIAQHAAMFTPGGLTLGHRINLSPEQTERLVVTGEIPGDAEVALGLRHLEQAHTKATRQQWLRQIGLVKSHKPQAIGAHLAVDFDLFCLVNGFDETYEGYGCEDDDFVRRIYRVGGRSTNAVRDIRTFHLYHETRACPRWRDNPGAQHFLRDDWRPACARGFWNPLPQNPVKRLLL